MADVDSILRQLPALTPEQLRKIVTGAQAAAAFKGTSISSPSSDERESDDYLLEGVAHELRNRGLLSQRSRIPRERIPPGYVTASAEIRRTLEERLPKALSGAERAALGRLAGMCLASYVERGFCGKNTPISVSVMLQNINKVLAAIDLAFPNYLQNGWLLLSIMKPK